MGKNPLNHLKGTLFTSIWNISLAARGSWFMVQLEALSMIWVNRHIRSMLTWGVARFPTNWVGGTAIWGGDVYYFWKPFFGDPAVVCVCVHLMDTVNRSCFGAALPKPPWLLTMWKHLGLLNGCMEKHPTCTYNKDQINGTMDKHTPAFNRSAASGKVVSGSGRIWPHSCHLEANEKVDWEL